METGESEPKNCKKSVDVSVTYITGRKMSTQGDQHEQECTPARNGQEDSPSHFVQDNKGSDMDAVQGRDTATDVH